MSPNNKSRLTLIVNEEKEKESTISHTTPPPDINYHTNPMYEKLLNFKELQKKKRFTVEDLLKW